MQRYVDINYYLTCYKGNGKIPDSEIDNLIIESSKIIQKYTSNRASSKIDAVKYCCCKLMEKINSYNEQKIKNQKMENKKSESVGKWSIGYGDVKSDVELNNELKKEISEIINLYLSDVTDEHGVKLLYRGRSNVSR